MAALIAGENPRKKFRRHRERGPSRFFTFDDFAQAACRSPATMRSVLRTSTDARTASLYVTKALVERSRKLRDTEVTKLYQDSGWKNRWPRFDLWTCGVPGCTSTLLEPGLCAAHGGPKRPLVIVSDDRHFMIWMGQEYVPICQVMLGVNHPIPIVHLDGNSWNSHPDNLMPDVKLRLRRHRWSYGYRELSNLFGLSETGVRQAASRGLLDPASLTSVCSFWALRSP